MLWDLWSLSLRLNGEQVIFHLFFNKLSIFLMKKIKKGIKSGNLFRKLLEESFMIKRMTMSPISKKASFCIVYQ